MGERGKWAEKLQRQMALSQEPIPGVPLIEITGQNRILIENHRGVCCYSRELIRVRVQYGEISITGTGLDMARMSREVLVITGRMDCITLHREANR